AKYGKAYKDADDELIHYKRYNEQKQAIDAHNQRYAEGLESYDMGVNQYTDMTDKEFANIVNGFNPNPGKNMMNEAVTTFKTTGAPVPDSVDWRTKGVVTKVKDQQSCASCWAFSAIGALEGQHAKVEGKLVELSIQNLVDCMKDEGITGCSSGGWPYLAYQYIIREAQGVDTEASYPTINKDNPKCMFTTKNIGARAHAFGVVMPGDEVALKEAVATIGPLSMCVITPGQFTGYKSGVFDVPTCGTQFEWVNHCMLIVGYGTDEQSGKDYWLVKNSMGTQWGEQGYIKMARNHKNQCGVATVASYPVVNPV
ncbi:unnamed protein product, partial [Oppiella nova]